MSAPEWRPGDVAECDGLRVMFTRSPYGDSLRCFDEEGDERAGSVFTKARRLVVIDPEDTEQVERLRDAWADNFGVLGLERLRAALREFATPTPPKPEEPLGLGAVVVERSGQYWVHTATASPGHTQWVMAGCPSIVRDYADLDVVRVLSEGVTA